MSFLRYVYKQDVLEDITCEICICFEMTYSCNFLEEKSEEMDIYTYIVPWMRIRMMDC